MDAQSAGTTSVARLLVVDDESAARLAVKLALKSSERIHIIGEAPNGLLGVEMAERLQPDIVVLDLMMPVMDGFEAIPLVRVAAPKARILVRSSHEDTATLNRAMQLGATSFLSKLTPPVQLRATIEALAERVVPHSSSLGETTA